MEIFTEEFKNELSRQLDEITFESKKVQTDEIFNFELNKALQEALKNYEENLKEKNKKNQNFKKGDIVYLGDLQGEIIDFCDSFECMEVLFEDGSFKSFLTNGFLTPNSPKLLSYYPYELKMKKI